jgi:D-alanyl-D-alanine carboxypeptidase
MNRRLKIIFAPILLALAVLPQRAAAANPSPRRAPSAASRAATGDQDLERLRGVVRAKLEELRRAADFPGATAGFVLPDGRASSVSVGLADVEANRPLAPTDRMLSGSIGKTYVAAVVMQLLDEGRLELDARIERWLGGEPWFARLPNARDITLRMLMNHTSGIPEHVLDKNFIAALRAAPDRVWKPEELVAYVLDAKPLFAAGQGWSYADTNYILVGMIVERVTRRTFYEEASRRVLKPLRLRDTLPSTSRRLPGLVPGYSMANSPFGFEGRTITGGLFRINPQMEWTGGGFVSTAEDLARWAKALYEGKAFKQKYLDEMISSAVPARTGRGDKYGLGVQVRESEWGASYGHGGWFPGYLSEMEYFTEPRLAVAVQFNTDAVRRLKRSPRGYVAEIARVLLADAAVRKRAA